MCADLYEITLSERWALLAPSGLRPSVFNLQQRTICSIKASHFPAGPPTRTAATRRHTGKADARRLLSVEIYLSPPLRDPPSAFPSNASQRGPMQSVDVYYPPFPPQPSCNARLNDKERFSRRKKQYSAANTDQCQALATCCLMYRYSDSRSNVHMNK